MDSTNRFLIAYELLGSKPLSRTLCFITKYYQSPVVILLGNTTSPEVLDWLKYKCKIEVLGVLGRYDEASVASRMRALNSLIECREVSIGNITVYGYGFSGCSPAHGSRVKIDLLVTSMPGLRYSCCEPCSDTIDEAIEALNPRLVITGNCEKPCFNSMVFSPGSIQKGYIGVVESKDHELKTSWINIHSIIYSIIV